MNDGTLTNETYCIFCEIYKEYKKRKKAKEKRTEINYFFAEELEKILENYNDFDIDNAFEELKENDFIQCDIIGGIMIMPKGINFMENRLTKSVDKFIDTISKLK